MKPLVSIIMGSTSDLPVMEKACQLLNELQVPFEVNALSAHRTPEAVEAFASGAKGRGLKVIIAAAGMAAALPGVIAASTTLPVIGVPIKGMLDGYKLCVFSPSEHLSGAFPGMHQPRAPEGMWLSRARGCLRDCGRPRNAESPFPPEVYGRRAGRARLQPL